MNALSKHDLRAQGYFNVPNRRARHFMGRTAILSKLQDVGPEERLLSRCIVLRGLGGQGKTQIALEYCQQTRKHPLMTTLWIDASSEQSIRKSVELFYERFREQSEERLYSIEAIIDTFRDAF